MQLDNVEYIVGLFISNYKLQTAIVNKLAIQLKLPVNVDLFKLYHHDLTKLNLVQNWIIGYMPNNVYYDKIIKLDHKNYLIVDVPRTHNVFKYENNPKRVLNDLLNRVDKCNKFLAELKNASL